MDCVRHRSDQPGIQQGVSLLLLPSALCNAQITGQPEIAQSQGAGSLYFSDRTDSEVPMAKEGLKGPFYRSFPFDANPTLNESAHPLQIDAFVTI